MLGDPKHLRKRKIRKKRKEKKMQKEKKIITNPLLTTTYIAGHDI